MISRRAFLLVGLVAGTARAQLPPNIAEIRQAALKEAIAKVTGNAAAGDSITIANPARCAAAG